MFSRKPAFGMTHPQHAADALMLSATQLRSKYIGTYNSWRNMKQRAKREGHFVASEFEGFPSFLISMGPRPDLEYTIDRIDPADPEYAANKCRWLDWSGQANNRSTTKWLTVRGVSKPLTMWATETSQKPDTLRNRLRNGWTHEQTVEGKKGLRHAELNSAANSGRFGWMGWERKEYWEKRYNSSVLAAERALTRYEFYLIRSRALHAQLDADIQGYKSAEGPTNLTVAPEEWEQHARAQIEWCEEQKALIAKDMKIAFATMNKR